MYDSLSRLTSAMNPEAGTTGYTYDANSNLLTRTDARGIITTYGYDALNRPTGVQYSDGTPSVSYVYDQVASQIETSSFGNFVGRLSQAYTSKNGVTLTSYWSVGYDAKGRPYGYVECYGSSSCMTNGTSPLLAGGYFYDLIGDVLDSSQGVTNSLGVPTIESAAVAENTYDSAGRLSSVLAGEAVLAGNVETESTETAFNAMSASPSAPAYSPLGGLMNAQLSINAQQQAAITLTRTYDPRGRLTGETDLGGTQQSQIYKYTLGFTLNSNVNSFNDSVMGTWSSLGYDSLDRLTSGSSSSGAYSGLTVNWTYDSYGNRMTQTPSGNYTANVPAQWVTYNTSNRVTGTNLMPAGDQYDASGDVQNDGINQYLYDAEGRVCAVQNITSSATVGYVYDGEGRRLAKGTISTFSCDVTTNGFSPTSEYVVGLKGEQLAETDGQFNLLHGNIFANGKLLVTYLGSNSNWYYSLNDWLGTKRVEANADGSIAASFLSLPFGDGLTLQGTGPDATENHFTGKVRDTESGNDYFGARYYASSMGRWLSPDWSAKVEPIPYAKLDDPQSLNLYAYVQNNPLTASDADGHLLQPPLPVPGGDAYNSTAGQALFAYENGGNPSAAAQSYQAQQQQSNEIAGQINHETLGMKDSKTENEPLASAEDKIAHVRLNGIKKWGSNEKAQKYASLVSAIEKGPGYKISQQAVEQAIREDSKGIDPTHGAIFYNMRTESQFKHDGAFQGQSIHTYSGPYTSPGPYKYIMTYGP
ncbi:MAG TPA: RHS repeat-associated core domain-containing protein [Terriglobia bacterium]|nr:RHS repeat-associated core domain-containing protein [Terriglobia bacterium]